MEPSASPINDVALAAIRIRRSVQRLSRQLRLRRSDQAVSGTKRSVLGTLYRSNKPMTAAELARVEHLLPQSLTKVVAELEEEQLIERTQDESDRRQLLISITEAGRDLLIVDARSQIVWLASAMSSHLSKPEQDILSIAAELVERICDASGPPDDQPLSASGESHTTDSSAQD